MYLHQELQVHTLLPNQGKSITFEDIVNSVSTQVRSIIADYAVVLTLVIFVTFDHAFNLATPKLTVPTELKVQTLPSVFFFNEESSCNLFQPTRSDLRNWWIPLTDPSSSWYIYIITRSPSYMISHLFDLFFTRPVSHMASSTQRTPLSFIFSSPDLTRTLHTASSLTS